MEEVRERRWSEYDQDTWYTFIKLSTNKQNTA